MVEGYTDCLAAHQAGFTETVATLGTAMTESQVDLLRRYCDEVILLFDSDQAGEAAADRAIRVALPRCLACRLARIPDGKDPSEFLNHLAGADAFSDVLNGAVPALEFKWLQTRERFGGDYSDAHRREAVLDFLRVVAEAADARMVDAIQRGLLVNQVAHLLQMPRSEVLRLMDRLRPRRREAAAPAQARKKQPSAVPQDGVQAAWTRVLEVLLNEPRACPAAEELPDMNGIADERDRRIARIVSGLIQQGGEYRLADVLARCEEPGDSDRVAALAQRGAHRGNFEATLQIALAQLGRTARGYEVQRGKERFLRAGVGREAPSSAEAAHDQEMVSGGVKEHRHFVPRRLIHPRVDDIVPTSPQP